jgi:hypothetical protein
VSRGVKTAASLGLALAAGAALAWAAAEARAHVEWEPTAVNRYLNLWLAPGRLEYQHSLLYGTHPARLERERLDVDRDGAIEQRELEAEVRALADRAPAMLQLRVDGKRVALGARAELDLNGHEGVEATPLLSELSGTLALAPRRHRLEISLGPDVPRMGETEIVVETDGWVVVASEQPPGRPTAAPQRRFQFSRPRATVDEPRALVLVLEPGDERGARRRWLVYLAAALVMAAAGVALWTRRRRAG